MRETTGDYQREAERTGAHDGDSGMGEMPMGREGSFGAPSTEGVAEMEGPSGDDGGEGAASGGNGRLVRIGILFMVAILVAWLVWLFVTGKASLFADALRGAHLGWIAAGMGCFVGFFLLDALCFRISSMLTGVRMGLVDLLSVAAAGIVFGYLTPGQMGAAPAQIVRLSKAGLSVGDASAVQLTRFFVYQAAVTLFGLAVLVVKFPFFQEHYGNVMIVAVLAFLVHLGIMLMLVGLIFFPGVIRKVGGVLITLGARVRVVRDADAARVELESQIEEYATSVHGAVRHASVIISAIVITICQLAALYTVPYCVIRALGVTSMDFVTCVCAAAFVQLVLTAVPLPGGTGGAEGGFAVLYGAVLGDLVSVAVVIWRAITFYLPVICSAPLLALKSRVTPAERLETFGDAHVGREGLRDDLSVASRRASEFRESMRQRKARGLRGDKAREGKGKRGAGRQGGKQQGGKSKSAKKSRRKAR